MSTAKSIGKKILIIVVIVIVLAVVYTLFFKHSTRSSSEGLISTDQTSGDTAALPENDAATNDAFLNTLLHLRGITLDESIFQSNSFTSLADFTITLLQPATHGRPNPFAPIGSDGSSTTVTPDSLTTASAASVTATSAILGGSLLATLTPSERWFEWGTSPAPSTRTASITSTSAPFMTTLSGLSPNTTYYYKAASKSSGVVYYGSIVSFKTTASTNVPSGTGN